MGTLTRATKNITRRKTRALLVIIALSLALTILTSIPPSITANQQATQKTINNISAGMQQQTAMINMVATQIECSQPLKFRTDSGPYHNETTFEKPLMNITDYSNLTRIANVDAVIPIMQQLQTDTETKNSYSVVGIPTDGSTLTSYPSILPANITEGRNLQPEDTDVVVLQERAAELFGVGVGDTVEILGQSFQVVGIQGLDAYNMTAVYMSLGEAQSITNSTGKVYEFKVFVNNVEDVGAVESEIKKAYPDLEVITAKSLIDAAQQTQQLVDQQINQAQNTFNQVQSTALMEMSVVVVADCVIVLFIMLYTVRERTKEIGILKAMGASNSTILGQFLVEGTMLSLIAGAVGITVGSVVATSLASLLLPRLNLFGADLVMTEDGHLISEPIAVTMTPEMVLLGLGAAVLLGALGTLYPAWRAARIRPAEAMRYE
ncbi:MAG: ABC transporter permease [Candidatus Bathyarchaeia archaeon]|jgi:putative ABC transport system permease protein